MASLIHIAGRRRGHREGIVIIHGCLRPLSLLPSSWMMILTTVVAAGPALSQKQQPAVICNGPGD